MAMKLPPERPVVMLIVYFVLTVKSIILYIFRQKPLGGNMLYVNQILFVNIYWWKTLNNNNNDYADENNDYKIMIMIIISL